MDAAQGTRHIRQKVGKRPLHRRAGATDQNVVPPWQTARRQGGAGNLAQTALGTVAGNGIADLPGTGVAHPDVCAVISAAAGLQQKARHRLTPGLGRPQKVGAL